MGVISMTTTMSTFTGFPSGKNPYVPIPEIFFTQLLPEIEDYAELKVTLHLFWLLAKKQSGLRCISDPELRADRTLFRSLQQHDDSHSVEERLHQGLELAVERRTLLRIHLRMMSTDPDTVEFVGWYFFNTARSRKAVAELQGGEVLPARLLSTNGEQTERVEQTELLAVSAARYSSTRDHNLRASEPSNVPGERPNIFVLYEQNIGLLTPSIAEKLRDAHYQYPSEWIEAAFQRALQYNKRSWDYISAILKRWGTEGRQ